MTLENAPLFRLSDADHGPRPPQIVSRYQLRLTGAGRVSIPLAYEPDSDEARGRMLASLGSPEGDRIVLGPQQAVSRLAYQTESLMRVWVLLVMLPEGVSPDSLARNQLRRVASL